MTRRERARARSSPGYARTARLGELLREIISDELRTIDDDRLELVAITAVDVTPDLTEAVVYYTPVTDDAARALAGRRGRLRKAIGDQARVRRVPELAFRPDGGVQAGTRIDEILRDLRSGRDEQDRDEQVRDEQVRDEQDRDEQEER